MSTLDDHQYVAWNHSGDLNLIGEHAIPENDDAGSSGSRAASHADTEVPLSEAWNSNACQCWVTVTQEGVQSLRDGRALSGHHCQTVEGSFQQRDRVYLFHNNEQCGVAIMNCSSVGLRKILANGAVATSDPTVVRPQDALLGPPVGPDCVPQHVQEMRGSAPEHNGGDGSSLGDDAHSVASKRSSNLGGSPVLTSVPENRSASPPPQATPCIPRSLCSSLLAWESFSSVLERSKWEWPDAHTWVPVFLVSSVSAPTAASPRISDARQASALGCVEARAGTLLSQLRCRIAWELEATPVHYIFLCLRDGDASPFPTVWEGDMPARDAFPEKRVILIQDTRDIDPRETTPVSQCRPEDVFPSKGGIRCLAIPPLCMRHGANTSRDTHRAEWGVIQAKAGDRRVEHRYCLATRAAVYDAFIEGSTVLHMVNPSVVAEEDDAAADEDKECGLLQLVPEDWTNAQSPTAPRERMRCSEAQSMLRAVRRTTLRLVVVTAVDPLPVAKWWRKAGVPNVLSIESPSTRSDELTVEMLSKFYEDILDGEPFVKAAMKAGQFVTNYHIKLSHGSRCTPSVFCPRGRADEVFFPPRPPPQSRSMNDSPDSPQMQGELPPRGLLRVRREPSGSARGIPSLPDPHVPRSELLQEIVFQVVDRRNRLVTVTGPSKFGKTTICAEAAQFLASQRFFDGIVLWVDCRNEAAADVTVGGSSSPSSCIQDIPRRMIRAMLDQGPESAFRRTLSPECAQVLQKYEGGDSSEIRAPTVPSRSPLGQAASPLLRRAASAAEPATASSSSSPMTAVRTLRPAMSRAQSSGVVQGRDEATASHTAATPVRQASWNSQTSPFPPTMRRHSSGMSSVHSSLSRQEREKAVKGKFPCEEDALLILHDVTVLVVLSNVEDRGSHGEGAGAFPFAGSGSGSESGTGGECESADMFFWSRVAAFVDRLTTRCPRVTVLLDSQRSLRQATVLPPMEASEDGDSCTHSRSSIEWETVVSVECLTPEEAARLLVDSKVVEERDLEYVSWAQWPHQRTRKEQLAHLLHKRCMCALRKLQALIRRIRHAPRQPAVSRLQSALDELSCE